MHGTDGTGGALSSGMTNTTTETVNTLSTLARNEVSACLKGGAGEIGAREIARIRNLVAYGVPVEEIVATVAGTTEIATPRWVAFMAGSVAREG